LLGFLSFGCDRPPPTAYANGWNAAAPQAQESIGANAVGEACSLQDAGSAGRWFFPAFCAGT